MSYYISVILTLFSIFPSWFTIFICAFLALMIPLLVIKLVAFVKSAIPFL